MSENTTVSSAAEASDLKPNKVVDFTVLKNSISPSMINSGRVIESFKILIKSGGTHNFLIVPETVGKDDLFFKRKGEYFGPDMIKIIYLRLGWFQGAFPSYGPAVRPDCPSKDMICHQFDKGDLTFPKEDLKPEQLLNAINGVLRKISILSDSLPNCKFYIDMLKVFRDRFAIFKTSGYNRVWKLLRFFVLFLRSDGFSDFDRIRGWFTYDGDSFPKASIFMGVIEKHRSWKGLVTNHVLNVVEVEEFSQFDADNKSDCCSEIFEKIHVILQCEDQYDETLKYSALGLIYHFVHNTDKQVNEIHRIVLTKIRKACQDKEALNEASPDAVASKKLKEAESKIVKLKAKIAELENSISKLRIDAKLNRGNKKPSLVSTFLSFIGAVRHSFLSLFGW